MTQATTLVEETQQRLGSILAVVMEVVVAVVVEVITMAPAHMQIMVHQLLLHQIEIVTMMLHRHVTIVITMLLPAITIAIIRHHVTIIVVMIILRLGVTMTITMHLHDAIVAVTVHHGLVRVIRHARPFVEMKRIERRLQRSGLETCRMDSKKKTFWICLSDLERLRK